MKKRPAVLALCAFAVLVSCNSSKKSVGLGEVQSGARVDGSSYSTRIGVAVSTGGRTCLAIRNSNIASSTPVTLVTPTIPQSFTASEIGATSESACPVTKDVDTSVTNYELHLAGKDRPQKLVPLIAIVAPAASFRAGVDNDVRSDFDANGKSESFRACSAADGLHLTVWLGDPLTGTLLWHGFYYQPQNTMAAPPCTPKEASAP